MSVCLAAEWAAKSLIALLVTAVTYRIVEMPPRTGAISRCPRATVSTNATILCGENSAILEKKYTIFIYIVLHVAMVGKYKNLFLVSGRIHLIVKNKNLNTHENRGPQYGII